MKPNIEYEKSQGSEHKVDVMDTKCGYKSCVYLFCLFILFLYFCHKLRLRLLFKKKKKVYQDVTSRRQYDGQFCVGVLLAREQFLSNTRRT